MNRNLPPAAVPIIYMSTWKLWIILVTTPKYSTYRISLTTCFFPTKKSANVRLGPAWFKIREMNKDGEMGQIHMQVTFVCVRRFTRIHQESHSFIT